MKKIDLQSLKQIDWLLAVRKNKYVIVSVCISILYFYATFFAISLVVKDIRDSLSVNDSAAKDQVIGFDLATYQKIAPRFTNNENR